MSEKYVVFDFETTGLSPQKNEIIQIGAVKFDENDVEIGRFDQLVKPQRSYVSTTISDLTGIYPRDLLGKPYIQEVLPDFLDFIAGHLLVAHNAPFDVSFLYQAIVDCDIRNAEQFHIYDTLSEAKRLMKAKSYKLEYLKDLLGVDLRSHDALNDCLITSVLYQHLQELAHPKPKNVQFDEKQLDLFADFDGMSEEITENLRRKLGLPITKNLVYYRHETASRWQKFEIKGISIEQEYSMGSSLRVSLYNEEKVRIHSDFLKEMQKANFVDEMEKED